MSIRMNLRALSAAAAGVAALAAAAAAQAQSIDYGSLESLFGEPVTTSATGSPQRASEAPVPMDIITAEDIKRSGAVDIPTILSRLAGLNVLTWGAGSADVGVRGYNQAQSPRLLVLINGRQVYIDTYGYTNWASLPVQLSEIRQIEVVKGPNSALFGFNAVSGVINIVTYNPKYDQVGAASGTVGTQSYGGANIVQTMKINEMVSARLSVGASRSDEFKNDNPSISQSSLDNPSTADVSLDTIAQLTSKLQARIETSWSNTQASAVLPQTVYTPARTMFASGRATLIDESPIGLLQGSVYENEVSLKFDDLGTLGHLWWDNKVFVADAQDLVKVDNKDTIRVSLEYRHNEMDSSPLEFGSVFYDVYSPSVMWNSTITSKVSVTAAVRYDELNLGYNGTIPSAFQITTAMFDRSIGAVSANAGVVYKATTDDTLRLSYARGVQSPTLAEFGGVMAEFQTPNFPVAITGNPGISPTIVTNYETDWDRTLPQLGAKASLRVFYQQTDDIKALPTEQGLNLLPGPGKAGVIWFQNVGDSEMDGVEAQISGTFGKGWRWNANYTYTNVHDKADAGISLLAHWSDFAQTTPKDMANLGLGWSDKKWVLDGYLHYSSSFDGYSYNSSVPTLVKVGAYATLAGRVAYNLTNHLTLAVSGQELQSDHTVETVGLPVERRVFGTLSSSW